jgi:hypothetical protein
MASDDEAAPLPDWPRLGARGAMRALKDLPLALLMKLHVWEERHLRRTSVLAAIRRAMDRAGDSPS